MATVEDITELFLRHRQTVALQVLKCLDLESFLAFRLVCQDWREVWMDNVGQCHRHKKQLRTTSLQIASQEGWMLVAEVLIARGASWQEVYQIRSLGMVGGLT